jgi:multicomponent Na+:H+ antiporter subunit F
MNAWMIAAEVLLFALVPCGIAAFRGGSIERLVGVEMAGVVESILLVLLAEAIHRPSTYDLAVALALLTFGGGLVFARFLERWL